MTLSFASAPPARVRKVEHGACRRDRWRFRGERGVRWALRRTAPGSTVRSGGQLTFERSAAERGGPRDSERSEEARASGRGYGERQPHHRKSSLGHLGVRNLDQDVTALVSKGGR